MKPECHACLGLHDDQFHQSLERILAWKLQRSVVAPLPVIARKFTRRVVGDVHSLLSPKAKRKAARK